MDAHRPQILLPLAMAALWGCSPRPSQSPIGTVMPAGRADATDGRPISPWNVSTFLKEDGGVSTQQWALEQRDINRAAAEESVCMRRLNELELAHVVEIERIKTKCGLGASSSCVKVVDLFKYESFPQAPGCEAERFDRIDDARRVFARAARTQPETELRWYRLGCPASGPGLDFMKSHELGGVIASVRGDSAAKQAGVTRALVVTGVDGKRVAGHTTETIRSMIDGPAGTKVKLRIIGSSRPAFEVTLDRKAWPRDPIACGRLKGVTAVLKKKSARRR